MTTTLAKHRVTGIAGIFFKAKDPKALADWYMHYLGVPFEDWGGARFVWSLHDPDRDAYTVFSPFPQSTHYFEPSSAPFMVSFRVDDLDGMLAELRMRGAEVDSRVEESPLGRFGWVIDPEGNRVELWEPTESSESA